MRLLGLEEFVLEPACRRAPRSILRYWTEAANATIQGGHDEYPSDERERALAKRVGRGWACSARRVIAIVIWQSMGAE